MFLLYLYTYYLYQSNIYIKDTVFLSLYTPQDLIIIDDISSAVNCFMLLIDTL